MGVDVTWAAASPVADRCMAASEGRGQPIPPAHKADYQTETHSRV